MKDYLLIALQSFFTIITVGFILYAVPFLIRKGWGDAENRTKKVCDTCFRDIKKWNKVLKDKKLI